MTFVRASFLGSVVMLVTAASAATTTACFVCRDSAVDGVACRFDGGTYDESACRCDGAKPYPPTSYPPTSSEGTICTTDDSCSDGLHCRDTGACRSLGCDLDGGCTCYARGTCTTSECSSDLDCHTGAYCTHDGDAGPGTCLLPCLPSTVCASTKELGRCVLDADCRASEGATCKSGWCHGPAAGDGGGGGDGG